MTFVRKTVTSIRDLPKHLDADGMLKSAAGAAITRSKSWANRAKRLVGFGNPNAKQVNKIGVNKYMDELEELKGIRAANIKQLDELDNMKKLVGDDLTQDKILAQLKKLDEMGVIQIKKLSPGDAKKLAKLKGKPPPLSAADDFKMKKIEADQVKLNNTNLENLDEFDATTVSHKTKLKKVNEEIETKKTKTEQDLDKFKECDEDCLDKGLTKKYDSKSDVTDARKRRDKQTKWNKKQKAAVVIGAVGATAGIHAGITGQSFKESNKDVMRTLREGTDPLVDAAGVVGAGAVAIAAETTTTLVKAGVDSSGPLLDELGKGVSNIGAAFGLGLPDFGFGDMGGTIFIVVILVAYYFYQKSTSTTGQSVDTMIYN